MDFLILGYAIGGKHTKFGLFSFM